MNTVDPAILPKTIPHAAQRAAALWGPRPAIIEDGVTHSFSELWDEARRCAAACVTLGVGPGSRIAIWAPNSRQWIIAAIGAQICGAAIVPLNTRMKGREAGDILRRAKVSVLFTVSGFLGCDYPALLADEDTPDLAHTVLLHGCGWDEFLAKGQGADLADIDRALDALTPDTTSDIMFTSGTTGAPKGVMTAHGQVVRMFNDWGDRVDVREGDRFMIVNPFFHTFGYKAGWVCCLVRGATILPMAVFDAAKLADIIESERVTFIPGPPTIYQMLLIEQEKASRDFSSLRVAVTGAAPVPPSLIHRMNNELGMERVVNGYGMTEHGCVCMTPAEASVEQISASIGTPIPGVEVICADTDGREVPTGESGEFWVRGYGVMRGYLDDPEATAEAITPEGWLKTGDIGHKDADGYLYITDRMKDMYISGGFNCYPAEIEKLLNDHPGIEICAVVGMPDERLGEVGKAFVIPRTGVTLDPQEVIAWARNAMANYKVPRKIVIVDDLPRNAAGKVLRTVLRDMDA